MVSAEHEQFDASQNDETLSFICGSNTISGCKYHMPYVRKLNYVDETSAKFSHTWYTDIEHERTLFVYRQFVTYK